MSDATGLHSKPDVLIRFKIQNMEVKKQTGTSLSLPWNNR